MTAGPFGHCTDASLKDYSVRIGVEIERASGERPDYLLREVAALRDEMIDWRRGAGGNEDGAGVREPRRPRPGGSAAAAIIEPGE